ncbi:MAG: clostripain-related cysteine peptidase [Bacteroidales bacterium]|nr:clostripain-related cysteine peptidase [Bacteroidales bacterium]
MKKINQHIITILRSAALGVLPVLAACGSSNDEPTIEPTPDPDPTPRTVLVYMVAGSSSLGGSGYDTQDLNEMLTAAAEGQIGKGRLIIYHSPYATSSTNCIPVLKEVTAAGIDTLKIYPAGTSSVTEAQMSQVFADTKELAPAEDYGLVLWGHGTGWLQDGVSESTGKTYSYGGDFKKYMNITSLNNVIKDQGLSFVYFDCCYMGNVETLYEVRDAAPVMVGSATEVPLWGMPYDKNLKYFFSDTPDMLGAAQSTFEYNMNLYNTSSDSNAKCPVTISVVYTEGLEALARATREIYEGAESSWPSGYVPQRYTTSSNGYYCDLEHYVQELAQSDEQYQEWRALLDLTVAYAAASPAIWTSTPINTTCGLSTYIMRTASSATTNNYNELQWYADVASALFE